MAKEREKQLAYHHYVDKQKTAKVTAKLVGVTERTVGMWIKKGNWQQLREARTLSPNQRAENIEALISELASQRITLSQELERAVASGDSKTVVMLRGQLASVDDGASKWNKTLMNIQKEGTTLTTYLDVMEKVFNAMMAYDEELYLKTIAFQEHHIHTATDKLIKV